MSEPQDIRFPVGDDRFLEVGSLGPTGWFRDHAIHSLTCSCEITAPEQACDIGQALFRVAVAALKVAPRPIGLT